MRVLSNIIVQIMFYQHIFFKKGNPSAITKSVGIRWSYTMLIIKKLFILLLNNLCHRLNVECIDYR